MQRKSFLMGLALAAAGIAFTFNASAADHASADEAQAMVKRAVALVKSAGKDKALAEFNAGTSGFKDRDLYVMAYDKAGNNLAHGANAKLVGKNLIELKDADGKPIVKGLVDTGFGPEGKGWVEYSWPNPVTKAVEGKRTYVERVGDIIVGVGVYK